MADSAKAISELGRELHVRLVKLSGLFGTLGTRLNSTVRAYNEAVGSYESRVLPGARRFAEHGVVPEGRDPERLEPLTLSARTLHVAPLETEDEKSASLFDHDKDLDAPRLRPAGSA
jgi:DNA recombination protein RmuC